MDEEHGNQLVRILIETTDLGPAADDDLDWAARWLKTAMGNAPFHVESIRLEVVSAEMLVDD